MREDHFPALLVTSALTAQDTAHAASEVSDLLQRALAGRYDVLRPLGRGGMGFVFLARELALDRLVAIKVAIRAPGASTDSLERFRREARLAAALEHPGIVRVYAVGDAGDLSWFAMEYVDGPTLEQFVGSAGPLASPRLVQLLRELSDALAYAHARGIVHRDVKPANVLLAVDGRFLLTDFGIAKQHDEEGLTTTGRIIGTPAYMSPEQFRGGGITAASDQYSLGGVIVFAATGRPPFAASDIAALIRAHLLDPPPVLRGDHADVPPALDATVSRMMAKQPGDRFAALTDVLPALLAGDAVSPPATHGTGRAAPRARAVRGALVAAAVVVAVSGGVWWQRRALSVAPGSPVATAAPAGDTAASVAPVAAARTTSPTPAALVRPPSPAARDTGERPPIARPGERTAQRDPSRPPDSQPAPAELSTAPARVARAPSTVRVGSRISGAVLHVNDRAVDVLTEPRHFDVPTGIVRLSIRADRCASWDSTLIVAAGDSLSLGYRNPLCR